MPNNNSENLHSGIDRLSAQLLMIDFSIKEDVEEFILAGTECQESAKEAGLDIIEYVFKASFKAVKKIDNNDADKIEKLLAFSVSHAQTLINTLPDKADHKSLKSDIDKEIEVILGKAAPSIMKMTDTQVKELPDFIANSKFILEDIEKGFLILEDKPDDVDNINKIFCAFHTIKGESGLLGLINLTSLAHEVESLLDKIRSNKISFDEAIATVLLNTVDTIRIILEKMSSDPEECMNYDITESKQLIVDIINQKETTGQDTSTKLPNEKEDDVKNEEDKGEEDEEGLIEATIEEDLVAPEYDEDFEPTVPVLDLSEGPEILKEFVVEGLDHLDKAENSLLILEDSPHDKEAINNIFRAFHTIKGISDFLNLTDIRMLSHEVETLLDKVRMDKIYFEGGISDVTFAAVDNLRRLLILLDSQVANNGELTEEYHDIGPLLKSLRDILQGKKDIKKNKPLGELIASEAKIKPEDLEKALEEQRSEPVHKKIGDILVEKNLAKEEDVKKALNAQKSNYAIEESIKINIQKLDALNELVGELVIGEAQVVQNPTIAGTDDQRLVKNITHLNYITRRLQEISMSMRLVPIRPIFQKMMRLVRDLSKKAGKEIRVLISGEDTEIDKNMVDIVSDPLVHMIRNAVDHGIELPAERIAKGKPSYGTIELRAYHKASNVVVEVQDNGRGLDKSKILSKARQMNLFQNEENLSDNQVYNMIFAPSFSTATEITDVSGRGVGMDVVKRNIEKLRGKVEITSRESEGSVFSVQLPITLAIIDGITLSVGSENYILPISSVVIFIKPSKENITLVSGKKEVLKVRGDLYPIVRISELFGVKSVYDDIEDMTACIVESEYGRACILVDKLLGQQQIVIKSLGEKLKNVKGIAGATIMIDGRIGLILDANGIVEISRNMMDS